LEKAPSSMLAPVTGWPPLVSLPPPFCKVFPGGPFITFPPVSPRLSSSSSVSQKTTRSFSSGTILHVVGFRVSTEPAHNPCTELKISWLVRRKPSINLLVPLLPPRSVGFGPRGSGLCGGVVRPSGGPRFVLVFSFFFVLLPPSLHHVPIPHSLMPVSPPDHWAVLFPSRWFLSSGPDRLLFFQRFDPPSPLHLSDHD